MTVQATVTNADVPPAESGFTTSEFWHAAAAMTIGVLTLAGAIHPAPGVGDAIVGGAAVTLPPIAYALSRGIRKRGTPG